MKKKLFAVLLMVCVLASLPFEASASEGTPLESISIARYEAIVQLRVHTGMKGSIATSTCDYYLKDTSYSCDITLTLEYSTDKVNWEEEESWTDTFSGMRGSYSESKAVYSGYYYRTVATVKVYDKYGNHVETAEVEGSAVRY